LNLLTNFLRSFQIQALNTAIEFALFPNGPLCIGAWDSGTVGSLEACIFEIIALNQKNILNLLTNFLGSVQIHKGPTSDIELHVWHSHHSGSNLK
jgi:hypothetical protein